MVLWFLIGGVWLHTFPCDLTFGFHSNIMVLHNQADTVLLHKREEVVLFGGRAEQQYHKLAAHRLARAIARWPR